MLSSWGNITYANPGRLGRDTIMLSRVLIPITPLHMALLSIVFMSALASAEPRLSGIFTSSSNDYVAIVEIAPGDTQFLRKGDEVDLINLNAVQSGNATSTKGKVIKVTPNLVVLQTDQQELTLTLRGTLSREGTFAEEMPEEKKPLQLVVNAEAQENLKHLQLDSAVNTKTAKEPNIQPSKLNALLALPKDAKISRVGGERVGTPEQALGLVVQELNKKYGVVTVFADTADGEQRVYLFPE